MNYFDWLDINPDLDHILEFGVFQGSSFNAHARWLNAAFPDRRFTIRGFDTFTGLPEEWRSYKNETVAEQGAFNTDGLVPEIWSDVLERNDVRFYKGLFDETIPLYLTEAAPIGFLHIDCDLYSSTRSVLHGIREYIVPGTIIRFDDWVYLNSEEYNDHEQRAFYEWVAECGVQYEFFPQRPEKKHEKFVKVLGYE